MVECFGAKYVSLHVRVRYSRALGGGGGGAVQ